MRLEPRVRMFELYSVLVLLADAGSLCHDATRPQPMGLQRWVGPSSPRLNTHGRWGGLQRTGRPLLSSSHGWGAAWGRKRKSGQTSAGDGQ